MKLFGYLFGSLFLLFSYSCNLGDDRSKSLFGNDILKDTSTLYTYNKNGVLAKKVSIMADSTFHGIYKDYYLNGDLKNEANYHFGHRTGYWKQYYPNGIIASIHEYEVDRLNGPFRFFDEKGWLRQQGVYKNNHLFGKRECYYKNGDLKHVYFYEDQGKHLKDIKYHRSGNISAYKQYLDGQQIFSIRMAPDGRITRKDGNSIFDIQIDKTLLFWDDRIKFKAKVAIPPKWIGQFAIEQQAKSKSIVWQGKLTDQNNIAQFTKRILPNKKYKLILKATIHHPFNPAAVVNDEIAVVLDLKEHEIYYPLER